MDGTNGSDGCIVGQTATPSKRGAGADPEKRRERYRRYKASAKAKACRDRYHAGEKGKACKRRYEESPKAAERRARWRGSMDAPAKVRAKIDRMARKVESLPPGIERARASADLSLFVLANLHLLPPSIPIPRPEQVAPPRYRGSTRRRKTPLPAGGGPEFSGAAAGTGANQGHAAFE